MTASIVNFSGVKARYGLRRDEPCSVIILPVVRIESHPAEPSLPRPCRRARGEVLRKVRQMQEEMLRGPRS